MKGNVHEGDCTQRGLYKYSIVARIYSRETAQGYCIVRKIGRLYCESIVWYRTVGGIYCRENI